MDAAYAQRIMNMIKLFGIPIKVNKASTEKRLQDVGANLYIGNLDESVDEKLLYDTFSAFGNVIGTTRIQRDPDTNISRGFGFISYDNFASSDLAIECMNDQWLANKQIRVQYAFKKDSNERHGSQAERLLAAAGNTNLFGSANLMYPNDTNFVPNTLFSTGPVSTISMMPTNINNNNMMMMMPPPPPPQIFSSMPPPPPPPPSIS